MHAIDVGVECDSDFVLLDSIAMCFVQLKCLYESGCLDKVFSEMLLHQTR